MNQQPSESSSLSLNTTTADLPEYIHRVWLKTKGLLEEPIHREICQDDSASVADHKAQLQIVLGDLDRILRTGFFAAESEWPGCLCYPAVNQVFFRLRNLSYQLHQLVPNGMSPCPDDWKEQLDVEQIVKQCFEDLDPQKGC